MAAETKPDEYESPFYCATCDGPEVKRDGDNCPDCLAAMAEDAWERRADMDADRRTNEQREDV